MHLTTRVRNAFVVIRCVSSRGFVYSVLTLIYTRYHIYIEELDELYVEMGEMMMTVLDWKERVVLL